MRFAVLNIARFGKFTDQQIAFGQNPDFHVFYGENEAGKSTTLEALRALFFGMGKTTDYDFLHGYQDLAIQAEIENRHGERLAFTRRKNPAGKIMIGDNAPVDDGILGSFTGGVSEERFVNLFGLDQTGLRSGGENLLKAGSDLGQILFGAASGLSDIASLIGDFEQHADGLFKPRGQNQTIKQLLNEHDALKRQCLAATIKPEAVQNNEAQLERLQLDLKALTEEENELRANQALIRRNRVIRPDLIERHRLLSEIETLDDAARLELSRIEDIETALLTLKQASTEVASLDARIAELRKSLPDRADGVGVWLNHRDEIGRIADNRSLFIERRDQKRDLEVKKSGYVAALQRLCRQLRLDAARDDLMTEGIAPVSISGLRRLAAEDPTPLIAASNNKIDGLKAALDDASKTMPSDVPQGPFDDLERAIKSGARRDDLEDQLQAKRAAHSSLEKDIEAALSTLALWQGDASQLEQAALPLRATLEEFRIRHTKIKDQSAELSRVRKEIDAERAKLADERTRLLETGAPPSIEDIRHARAERDVIWSHLKAGLEGKKPATKRDVATSTTQFEDHILTADALSDQRADLAETAAKLTQNAKQQDDLEAKSENLRAEAENNARAKQAFDAEWVPLFSDLPLAVREPSEMIEWLEQAKPLQSRMAERIMLRAEIDQISRDNEVLLLNIDQALTAKGLDGLAQTDGLGEAVAKADRALRSVLDKVRTHENAQAQLTAKKAELAREQTDRDALQNSAKAWQSRWHEALKTMGFTADDHSHAGVFRAADIDNLLDQVGEFNKAVDFRIQAEAELAAIDAWLAAFDEGLDQLASKLGVERDPDPLVVADLIKRHLDEVENAEARIEAIEQQIDNENERRRLTAEKAEASRNALDAFASECGLEDATDQGIEALVQANRRRLAIESNIHAIQTRIIAAGDGRSLDELIEQASASTPDEDDIALREADVRIEALEREKRELSERTGAVRTELEQAKGSSGAERIAQDMALKSSELDEAGERYVDAVIQARLLKSALEIVRKKRQGPILARADRLFASLTQSRFSGLDTLHEGDSPVLVGRRDDGSTLPVAGMSEGTADQLFLALRLAIIAEQAGHGEPFPFIADDLLASFDDARAAAALKTLHDMSSKTQVLLFTHHQHLLELARQELGKDGFQEHRL